MKAENVITAIPLLALTGGGIAVFGFRIPVLQVFPWVAAVALLPQALMAIALIVVYVFFGGLYNDRPPCECGNCTSQQYVFAGHRPKRLNPNTSKPELDRWYFACPSCHTLWVLEGRIFYRMIDDELFPYSSLNCWGRWRPVI